MAEWMKANEHPVNQKAKSLLLKAKVKPYPAQLYILQLAQWGLESADLPLLHLDLPAEVEALLGREDQEAVLKWLVPPEENRLEMELPKAKSPEDGAWEVLDQLHISLGASVDGYPRPRVED